MGASASKEENETVRVKRSTTTTTTIVKSRNLDDVAFEVYKACDAISKSSEPSMTFQDLFEVLDEREEYGTYWNRLRLKTGSPATRNTVLVMHSESTERKTFLHAIQAHWEAYTGTARKPYDEDVAGWFRGYTIHVAPALGAFRNNIFPNMEMNHLIMRENQFSFRMPLRSESLECKSLDVFIREAFHWIMTVTDVATRNQLFQHYFYIIVRCVTQALIGVHAATAVGVRHYGCQPSHILLRHATDEESQYQHIQHTFSRPGEGYFCVTVPLRTQINGNIVDLPIAEITDFRHATMTFAEPTEYNHDAPRDKHNEAVDAARQKYGSGFDPIFLASQIIDQVRALMHAYKLDFDNRLKTLSHEYSTLEGSAWFMHSMRLFAGYMEIRESDKEYQHVIYSAVNPRDAAYELESKEVPASFTEWSALKALSNFTSEAPVSLETYRAHSWIKSRYCVHRLGQEVKQTEGCLELNMVPWVSPETLTERTAPAVQDANVAVGTVEGGLTTVAAPEVPEGILDVEATVRESNADHVLKNSISEEWQMLKEYDEASTEARGLRDADFVAEVRRTELEQREQSRAMLRDYMSDFTRSGESPDT